MLNVNANLLVNLLLEQQRNQDDNLYHCDCDPLPLKDVSVKLKAKFNTYF